MKGSQSRVLEKSGKSFRSSLECAKLQLFPLVQQPAWKNLPRRTRKRHRMRSTPHVGELLMAL